MKAPDNIIWHDPELIPSLTVSYSVPTQLFYNGQIAIMALSVFYLTSFRDQCNIYIYIYSYRAKKNRDFHLLPITCISNDFNGFAKSKLFDRYYIYSSLT